MVIRAELAFDQEFSENLNIARSRIKSSFAKINVVAVPGGSDHPADTLITTIPNKVLIHLRKAMLKKAGDHYLTRKKWVHDFGNGLKRTMISVVPATGVKWPFKDPNPWFRPGLYPVTLPYDNDDSRPIQMGNSIINIQTKCFGCQLITGSIHSWSKPISFWKF